MTQRRLETLADLGDRHALFAFCSRCHRSVRLDCHRLAAMYGVHFSIAALKHRLTCRECGCRPREIRITYAVPQRG